ncbi:double zinc ribbon domain-containing protein [Arhodomonas aquaeolei]|uniref:double zinc ribbon domain-containing protein n=1 Tax=Arhodomonas aquaeolei TaxID=2369 RepID=UPI002169DB1B|nr:double zinc ribbon domain-containing protein [Arhodomonas aquaeolei]MCS4505312.1 double zinc ribbon domain-containing protein [Arhodomonas aquaeolei]
MIPGMDLAALWEGIGRHLMAAPCRLCGEPPEAAAELCRDCRAALPWIDPPCPGCGLPLPPGRPDAPCGHCLRRPPPWQRLIAPLAYTPPVSGLVHAFKDDGDLAAGRLLADLLAGALPSECPGAILPVPLHRRRLRERGFNQAAEIARRLPGRTLHGSLQRPAPGPDQRGGNARRRRANVRRAFVADPRRLPRRVLVVDDVVTTAATLTAVTDALRRAGVGTVWVCAPARTLPDGARNRR